MGGRSTRGPEPGLAVPAADVAGGPDAAGVPSAAGAAAVAPHHGRRKPLGRQFRRLWLTFACSSLGDGFTYGAVPLLAVVVDPRPLAVSSVVAANSLPWLFLALHAGAVADRFERSRVMAVANIARGLVLGAMAAVLATWHANLPLLLAFVLVNASARAVYYSASQAAVPELVGPADLNRANGVLYSTEAATENLGGPVLGALAFAAARALPFAADAVTMTASGLSLIGLHTSRPAPQPERPRIWEGLRRLIADRDLRILVSLIATLAGLQGLVSGVLVLVATKDWGVHQAAFGAFLATQAVGNVLGGVCADRVARRAGTAGTLIGAAVLSGAGYLVMAATGSWLVAAVAFCGVGFAVGCGGVVAVSVRQRLTPGGLMGRVGSAWRGLVWGAAPTGALAAGGLAVAGGLRLPLLVAGAAQCGVAALLARPIFRRLSHLDGEPEEPSGTMEPAAAG